MAGETIMTDARDKDLERERQDQERLADRLERAERFARRAQAVRAAMNDVREGRRKAALRLTVARDRAQRRGAPVNGPLPTNLDAAEAARCAALRASIEKGTGADGQGGARRETGHAHSAICRGRNLI
ncbi:MAG: hypothetical protein H0S85_03055 [Desulfovibrionaceae bacterium]|jgi:hypothetical protein|nr:hypothetical protein [Desulfovibrionaceae bacterium]